MKRLLLLVFLLASLCSGQVAISGLPAAGSASGTDQLPANQAGTTRRVTVTQIGAALSGVYQGLDSDLTTFAAITPSANAQSLLGAADYAAMRTLLSLVAGTNVQAFDADLSTYAGITPSANVQSVLGAADHAAIRTLLGLVIGTNVQAFDADLSLYAGIPPNPVVSITVVGPGDNTATGDGKWYLPIPPKLNGMNLVAVSAHVVTVGTTGSLTVDLARCDLVATGSTCSGTVVDMLSTNLTVDSNESKSSTAAAAVIDTANDDVATDQVIRIDVDAVHTTPAKGLIVELTFALP